MGDAVHGKRPAQLHDCGRIDHRRPQQLVGQAVVRPLPGRRVEVAATDVEQHAAGERVPVGAQARRQEPDQAVTGRHRQPGHDPVALSDSDGEADDVEVAGGHGPGVLGHLPADQRAARLQTSFGDTLDELVDVIGVELADGDVVEEEQRRSSLRGDVVDDHRHQVDADCREAAGGPGDHRLGADPVGRRHQHGVLVPVLGKREESAEAADVTDDFRTEGPAHLVLDPPDRLLSFREADAGAFVRLGRHRAGAGCDAGSSSAPLGVVICTGIGYSPVRHAVQNPDRDAPVASITRSRSR